MDMPELNRELTSGVLQAEVQKDEAAARMLEIDTIPHFIIDGEYAISGAQDARCFLAVLKKAYVQNK